MREAQRVDIVNVSFAMVMGCLALAAVAIGGNAALESNEPGPLQSSLQLLGLATLIDVPRAVTVARMRRGPIPWARAVGAMAVAVGLAAVSIVAPSATRWVLVAALVALVLFAIVRGLSTPI